MVSLGVDSSDKVYPSRRASIAYLKADKAYIQVPSKYADFADVFLPKLAIELSEYMEINDYAIKLVDI